jgi:hypothetical protein
MIITGRRFWFSCLEELRKRGRGRHESGCFILGVAKGKKRFAKKVVYYDDLDPRAYASGVCMLDGDAFTKLWEICRAEKLSVIADIHTHPGESFQSEADRLNPMIARAGHIAIIVRNYADGRVWRHRLGLFKYEGDHRWTNLSGWKARRFLKVKWSLI